MGTVSRIKPTLSFPIGRPFKVHDQFNGPLRGEWYFRTVRDGTLFGPFLTEMLAADAMEETAKIEPFQDVYRSWWWTDLKGIGHGPFKTVQEADAAIVVYLNEDTK